MIVAIPSLVDVGIALGVVGWVLSMPTMAWIGAILAVGIILILLSALIPIAIFEEKSSGASLPKLVVVFFETFLIVVTIPLWGTAMTIVCVWDWLLDH